MLPTLMFPSTNLPWLHGRQFSYQNYTKVNTRHGCLLQCLPGEKQPSVTLRVTQNHHSKSCFPDTLQISVLLSSFQWWKYQKLGVFSDKTWKKKILLHCTDKFASLLIFCLLTWVARSAASFSTFIQVLSKALMQVIVYLCINTPIFLDKFLLFTILVHIQTKKKKFWKNIIEVAK